MPLFKTIQHTFTNGRTATVLIWHITETAEQLLQGIFLKAESVVRFQSMKSKMHQCGFLSIRHLLSAANLSDEELFYDVNGKPFLNNGIHISISHSHEFSTIVFSGKNIGIDIEKMRSKTPNIATKFCKSELNFLDASLSDYIKKLTIIWAAKETVFKIENEKGISFKDHIEVLKFENNTLQTILNFNNKTTLYEMQMIEIQSFILVFGIKINQ